MACIVSVAFSPNSSSLALLTGCSITAYWNPGEPSALAIRSAALMNLAVITPSAGVPTRSLLIASCKLHEEQLPQSPRPVMARSQSRALSIILSSAGAL